MTVIVKKVGGSMAVVIPKGLAQEMELAAGTPLEISTAGGAIVMRKSPQRKARRPRRPISEIVSQINPASYRRRRRELGEDGPVGKELW
jgi:antitoxin component of MazEF toxin-antitoxin module